MSSEALRRYQVLNHQRIARSVRAEMARIDQAPPEAGGGKKALTRKELCRLAGVGASTLKNPSHTELRREVDAWLRSKRSTKAENTTKRAATHRKELEKLARELDRFKLLYESLSGECAALRVENSRLKAGAGNHLVLVPFNEEV